MTCLSAIDVFTLFCVRESCVSGGYGKNEIHGSNSGGKYTVAGWCRTDFMIDAMEWSRNEDDSRRVGQRSMHSPSRRSPYQGRRANPFSMIMKSMGVSSAIEGSIIPFKYIVWSVALNPQHLRRVVVQKLRPHLVLEGDVVHFLEDAVQRQAHGEIAGVDDLV